ncbi:hypothetical protein DFQ28_009866 [Apophysomyces sp. BC1034]|nr:hypothetical protein DFQ28_009866 [Apophysomyces sp. BC1034]
MPDSPTATHRSDWRLILLLGTLAACGPISIDMYLPSLPTLADAFRIDASAAQITLTSFMFGFSIGLVLYGPLSDAYGRRPVLISGIVLYVLASIACAAAATIEWLIAARFLQALGAGAASVLAHAIARDAHEPADAARVLSMLAIIASIGPLLAPLLGGQLLLLGGWRAVFVTLTLFGTLCAIISVRRIPETWPAHKRHENALIASFAVYGRLLTDPVAWGHVLCGGMAFAGMFAYITATPFVYIDYFHVSAQAYGLFFALNIIGIMTGNFLNVRLIAAFGAPRMIAASSLICLVASVSVFITCVTGWGGLRSIVVSLFFVVGVVGVLGANCTTDLMYRYPRNAGAAAALFGAMQLALGALSSLAIGMLQDGTPRAMGIVIGICGVATYVGCGLIARWRERPARL